MKRAVILAMSVVAAGANASVLDMFVTPQSFSITSGTYVSTASGAGIIGGQRDIQASVTNNPFAQNLDVNVLAAGLAVVSNGFGTESDVMLQYDRLDEAGNTGAGKVLQNGGTGASLLGAGDNHFVIRFVDNDKQVQVNAVLRKNGVVLSSGSATLPALSGASVLNVAMNSADMAQADSVTFTFKADASGDYGIRSIESAVPEPGILAVFGLGLAALVARRARK